VSAKALGALIPRSRIACIGPVTAAAVREQGLKVDVRQRITHRRDGAGVIDDTLINSPTAEAWRPAQYELRRLVAALSVIAPPVGSMSLKHFSGHPVGMREEPKGRATAPGIERKRIASWRDARLHRWCVCDLLARPFRSAGLPLAEQSARGCATLAWLPSHPNGMPRIKNGGDS
jgi:hypothetical protein